MKNLIQILGLALLVCFTLLGCSRDDEGIYQVQYASPVKVVDLEGDSLKIMPKSVKLGDKVTLKYPTIDQTLTWVVDVNGNKSGASKQMVIVDNQLDPTKHFWKGEFDGEVPFDSTESVSFNVSFFKSDSTLPSVLVQLIK